MIGTDEKKQLLKMARDTLDAKIRHGRDLDWDPVQVPEALLSQGGAFVTLHMGQRLRGCIGLMESDLPIYETVCHMAIAAATADSRFAPVRPEELNEIDLEISILSPLQRLEDWRSIRLGTDGVLVRRGNRSGVFLPQVALETGWTLERFLDELCEHKAGLPRSAWKDAQTEVYAFTVDLIREVDGS